MAGAVYEAAIERLADPDRQIPADLDWYRFTTRTGGPVHVVYTLLQRARSCFGPEARLYDSAGKLLGTAQPPRNKSGDIVYRAAAPDTYFLSVAPYQIEPCIPPDEPYSFEVRSPAELVAPPGQKAVRPVAIQSRRRSNPRLRLSSARLRRGRLTVTGTLARGALPRRVDVTGRGNRGGQTLSFRVSARPSRKGRWRASALLPTRLRSVASLRYGATYRGDSRFAARTLTSRLVRAARR